MGYQKHNQSGFSVVEGLLVVLVIAAIGFAGYYVWHAQTQKTAKTTEKSVATKTAAVSTVKPIELTLLSGVKSTATPLTYSRDTASVIENIVSFSQPTDWRDDADTTAEGCVSSGIANCLGQTMIVPENEDEAGATYPDYFVVTVSAIKTSDAAKTVFANHWQDSDQAASAAYSTFTTTAGISGFKYDFEPTTPTTSNDNAYLEHVAYGISNGTYVTILDVSYFNRSNGSFANKDKTDYGKYAATVEQIAKTLHLSN